MNDQPRNPVFSTKQLRTYARDLIWGVRLTLQAAPRLLAAWLTLIVIQSLIAPAVIYATREAVNTLAQRIGAVALIDLLQEAAIPICAIAALLLLAQLFAGLTGLVRTALAEYMRDHVQSRIHEKTVALDLSFFESSESYDLLHRARIDAISAPAQLIEHLGGVAQSGLSLLAIAALLAVYSPVLPLLLLATAIPGLWVVGRYTLAANRWRLQNTAKERRSRYLDWVLTQREAAAEVRLFELGSYFSDSFKKLRAELRIGKIQLESSELRAELLASTISWLGLIGAMLWMLARASSGLARIGDIVMCYQGFQQGQKMLRSLLDGAGGIYKGLLFLDNLRTLLTLEPKLRNAAKPQAFAAAKAVHVRFEDVSFAYPDSKRTALSSVAIELRAGRVTAIVGDNGAGKSTLIKLLGRFYDPSAGRVLLNGIDLRELPIEAIRRNLAVLFQEPLRHHGSASDNIALGDLCKIDDKVAIETAAAAAGADEPIARLPNDYETILGKWFGGTELSTGEWQRIALARAFLRQSPVIALDEPTSAMDAWAEAGWLDRFRALVKGQTALIITHRFTTAMMADHIYVMRNGQVIESGSHSDLLRSNGYYAQGWHEQMRFRSGEHSRASVG